MIVTEKETYTILGDEEEGIKSFASFLEFIIPKAYADQNLVIDLLKYEKLSLEELLLFLPVSNRQRADSKSFVIVNKAVHIDQVPEEIMVVPTLGEAKDVIELEEIQRDLGF
ncbi:MULTISPECIES: ribonuclease Z [unclassified Leeuwenhoekiella]|uniref:ribonuclease Z n=1 Tax=unclassified Leeuwenhoekiella TaxID=2615029 RepID=UPI000C688583|nr:MULTISPECIES: ribonuclease Z [unclassified Leeuwenhoekiella]MAW95080.1 ribonuclease Z [Leeuwenhoekiella sp.]MBA79800.1 ribonuclease Z [Leeuwenhoekiella sp.]|tara:strand:- start:52368 stop:52703 length:336 start_codon:yes stop_codon:yes gene_type:complete